MLLMEIAAQLVYGSLSPVAESELRGRIEAALDAARADYSSREVTHAYLDLDVERPSIRRDRAGRYFTSSPVAPSRLVASLKRVAELADEVERIEPRESASRHVTAGLFAEPLLSASEEQHVALRIQRGDLEATRRLVSANTRLVWSIATKWRAAATSSVDVDDFFQDGCLGLIRAAEKFRPELGNKFSTYATWWIKQSIHRGYADKSRTIRLPVHVMERVRRVQRAERELEQQGSDPRSPDQLAEVARRAELTPDEVAHLRAVSQPITPLDDILDLPDPTIDLEETAYETIRAEALKRALRHLTDRERYVLEMRHGLGCRDPWTLAEVGRDLGVTRERIRQIEAQAIEKLTPAGVSADPGRPALRSTGR